MKVLYCCFSPYFSGAEQETLRALSVGFGGAKIICSCPRVELECGNLADSSESGSFEVSVANVTFFRFLAEVLRELLLRRPHLVMVSNLKSAVIAGCANLLFGVPYVWYVHDYLDHRGYIRRFLAGVLLRGAVQVLPNSKDVARVVSTLSGCSAPPVMYCAVRPPADIYDKKISHRCAVLYVGSINEWKGLRKIVEGLLAFKKVSGWSPSLHVAGQVVDEAYWRNILSFAAVRGLEIVYLGVRRDVPALMSAYEVLIHGTVEREPFGLVVAEGVQAGCFVISTGMGGVREILPDEMKVSTFTPSDPVSLATVLLYVGPKIVGYRRVRELRAAESATRFGAERFRKQIRNFAQHLAENCGFEVQQRGISAII